MVAGQQMTLLHSILLYFFVGRRFGIHSQFLGMCLYAFVLGNLQTIDFFATDKQTAVSRQQKCSLFTHRHRSRCPQQIQLFSVRWFYFICFVYVTVACSPPTTQHNIPQSLAFLFGVVFCCCCCCVYPTQIGLIDAFATNETNSRPQRTIERDENVDTSPDCFHSHIISLLYDARWFWWKKRADIIPCTVHWSTSTDGIG